MKTTLIISTYNRPEALSVCLDSVRFQTVMPDEVIVGDDGSTSETKDLIESFKKDFPVPLIHLWQEDNGFRLAMMRNKSVAAATGDYIIEIDGDIFLHNKFVEDHKRLAKPGHYLRGTRVNLGQKLTEEICKSRVNRRIYPWTIGIQNRAETAIHSTPVSNFFADRYKKDFPVPLIHLWQEDNGFRLAMMRNKSVAAATGDYIIEIDGDIFLHNKFVEDHKRLAKPGHYLRGTRVNLGQKLTEEICKSRVNRRIYPWTIGIQNRAETAIHSTPVSNFFADRYKKNVSSGLGCNMSFWRSDFLAINGYDEFFEGWGKEDDDLTHRLQRKGCKKRSLRFAGIVYHLWHGHESMESDQKNAEYFRKNNEKNIVYCENGVSKYLKQE